jgi:hypothetical protein
MKLAQLACLAPDNIPRRDWLAEDWDGWPSTLLAVPFIPLVLSCGSERFAVSWVQILSAANFLFILSHRRLADGTGRTANPGNLTER